jgi:hypothetical protein
LSFAPDSGALANGKRGFHNGCADVSKQHNQLDRLRENLPIDMKKLFTLATIALALPAISFAAPKKEAAAAATEAAKAPAKAAADAVKPARPLPMHARADAIDAGAKTFTMTRKDGVAVKHVVTATTEIKNGEAAAKFSDIKVGDFVNGLRNKKSDTEYEVVKITSFGPAPAKKAEDAPKK